MWSGALLLCFLLGPASAAKILGLFPYKGASHFYVFQSLLEELARRGHNVDVLSHLPRKEPLPNYTDISVANDHFPTKEFAQFDMMWSGALLLCFLLSQASAAKILGLFPYKGASHFYVFQPLLEELARRGHTVDVLSHLPRKQPLPNYTDISVADGNFPTVAFKDFQGFEQIGSEFFIPNLIGLKVLSEVYESVLSRPDVLALANSSYDLVITEMFNSDTFFGLTYKIGAPVIGFSSCQLLPWTEDSMAIPNDLPYIPLTIGGHGSEMDFFERVRNWVEVWISRIFYRVIMRRADQALAEKYLGPLPDLADIAANTSLLLVNSHFSLLGYRPQPPNVIEVGGINVPPPKPLPENLEKVYKNSKGVIYFSMGSVLQGSSMPKEKQMMFINAFVASGRTVLWKREKELTKNQAGIITSPWFPQRDILGHPKTELFISHCGLLGVNEAVISGVPIICIPMFGDQFYNARAVVESGIGLRLDYHSLNEEDIRYAITETLTNNKYKQRAAEVSAAFRDRPMSPLDTGVFWVEYVLRHGPRPFAFRAKQMSLWQRLGLDVVAFLLAITIASTSLFIIAIKLTFFRRKNQIKEKQS